MVSNICGLFKNQMQICWSPIKTLLRVKGQKYMLLWQFLLFQGLFSQTFTNFREGNIFLNVCKVLLEILLQMSTWQLTKVLTWFLIITSNHFLRRFDRSFAVVSFQTAKASWAAAMAAWVSFASMSGTFAMTAPFRGFVTSNVAPLAAPIHFPFTKALSRKIIDIDRTLPGFRSLILDEIGNIILEYLVQAAGWSSFWIWLKSKNWIWFWMFLLLCNFRDSCWLTIQEWKLFTSKCTKWTLGISSDLGVLKY